MIRQISGQVRATTKGFPKPRILCNTGPQSWKYPQYISINSGNLGIVFETDRGITCTVRTVIPGCRPRQFNLIYTGICICMRKPNRMIVHCTGTIIPPYSAIPPINPNRPKLPCVKTKTVAGGQFGCCDCKFRVTNGGFRSAHNIRCYERFYIA